MGFLHVIPGRPTGGRPFLVRMVGYPAPGVRLPAPPKKTLADGAVPVD